MYRLLTIAATAVSIALSLILGAAAHAATACMNLRLHYPHRAAQFFSGSHGLVD